MAVLDLHVIYGFSLLLSTLLLSLEYAEEIHPK